MSNVSLGGDSVQEQFRISPPDRVGRRNTADRPKRRQHDIMFEIMTHGPVQGYP